MDESKTLADQFEANRPRLLGVAYRILGTREDAEDALQEAWLRLSSTDDEILNLGGWLTTVVSRICLNTLRSGRRRRATPLDDSAVADELADRRARTPEDHVVLADSIGMALLVVLEMLTPAERICFVLHDTFSVPFEEIAGIVGRSSDACRQLASRARRRVRTADEPTSDPLRQREVVDAFLVAAKTGDLQTLLSLLRPDVELVADVAAVALGAPERMSGANDVALMFSGRAKAARTALVDGLAGLAWSRGRNLTVVFDFTVASGQVTTIEMIADPDVLAEMRVELPRRASRGR